MDNLNLLCDELLEEILQRLPPSVSPSISLVCKRLLSIHRTNKKKLSIRLPNNSSNVSSLSTLLSHYPSLATLTLLFDKAAPTNLSPDALLLSVASNSPSLLNLRFFVGPISPSCLCALSASFKTLTSLSISSLLPLNFRWLADFPSLKELSLLDCRSSGCPNTSELEFDVELPLESLSLSGIPAGDVGFGWLWRNCKKLRKLQLRGCEGTGDGDSFSSFILCLGGLQELELRTCRSIADGVLIQIAEHCNSLDSFLLYDGGSRDGLLGFIMNCRSSLRKLDLRLPLDLEDDHLFAVAENLRGLLSFRLQSCCLVTGPGLKSLGPAMSGSLEELVLINCDVVERELGLLTSLGQHLRRLRKLDLSFNDILTDKELGSMLVSCKNLVDIRLRGCGGLSKITMNSMCRTCKLLEAVDIMQCHGISSEAVDMFILNSPRLSRVLVEEFKVSDATRNWAVRRGIHLGD